MSLKALGGLAEPQTRGRIDVIDYGSPSTITAAAMAEARKRQQAEGGELWFGPGEWLTDGTALRGAPATGDAVYDLKIRGSGMWTTKLKLTALPANNGIIGPKLGVRNARIDIADLTLDGNYDGVDGGDIPQMAVAGTGSALMFGYVPWEIPDGNNAAPNGVLHAIRNVRFYRSAGFVFQASRSVHLHRCLFDQVGQPDLASGATHWDSLGSGGYTEGICEYCVWVDSSGNYADFIDTTGTKPISFDFSHNTSKNHQIGGVYVLGLGSRVEHNKLENTVVDGSIAYDSGNHANMPKGRNVVRFNHAPSLKMHTAAAPADPLVGDEVAFNFSLDIRDVDQLTPDTALLLAPPRDVANIDASVALTAGTLFLRGVRVKIGQIVSGCRFRSGGTALVAGGAPHLWASFHNEATRALLGQTPDDTAPVWNAATKKTFTLAAPITIGYTGILYVGIMANVGTPPNLSGITTAANIASEAPAMSGNTADVGLTTTAPNPAAAPSGSPSSLPYVELF